MKTIRALAGTILGFLAISLAHTAGAVVPPRCVADVGDLTQALADATVAPDGELQDIRLQAGDYKVDAPLMFMPDSGHDNKDFSLSGGWNAGCTSQVIDPSNTTIEYFYGQSTNYRRVLLGGDNHSYRIEGVRFLNVFGFKIADHDCGAADSCPATDSITIRYNQFRESSHVEIYTREARRLVVSNNLFDGFNEAIFPYLISIQYLNDDTPPDFSFNTMADMHCFTGSNNLVQWESARAAIMHHNIFQSDCSHDLYTSSANGGQPVSLRYNIYSKLGGVLPSDTVGNLVNADPGFIDPASNNYRLRTTAPVSAAINKGMTLAQLILDQLLLPAQDNDGPDDKRLIDARFDIGAFESDGPAPSQFVVTNTNDSGSGSFRAAISNANAAAGLQKVAFAISGTCPRKIALASPLPDIVDDLEIAGYTQPGWIKNSAQTGNNGTLCVEVGPAFGSTIAHTLHVPSSAPPTTNLTVRGVAFTGGHNVAVDLRGGSGHVIAGNAFGGVRPGGIDKLGDTNITHIAVRANALGAQIGGPDAKDRNFFGSSQLNAIVLIDATSGQHTVRNNYIGLDPGGGVPQAIGGNGISAQNSSYISIMDNVIDATSAGISISGASATGFQITGNVIGLDAYGGAQPSAANDYGIYLYGSTYGNAIGSLGGTTSSNVIANNARAGVWIDATAGGGILVRPNSIYGNGYDGAGLGIDIGTLGPLSNDKNDADGGPNLEQNSPIIKLSAPNADGSRQASGRLNSVANFNYRIDLYRSPTCTGAAKDAKTFLGSVDTVAAADGVATFSKSVNGAGAPAYITAIATNTFTRNTSEIGVCFYEDTIFKSGAEVEPL